VFEHQLAALLALAIDIHLDAQETGRAAMRKAPPDRVPACNDHRFRVPELTRTAHFSARSPSPVRARGHELLPGGVAAPSGRPSAWRRPTCTRRGRAL